MVKKRRGLPRKIKSALTDLGIITVYEGLDWVDELIAKLFPGVGEIPEEGLDEIANMITLGMLTGAPYTHDRIYKEKWGREEFLERTKKYGKAALVEAGQVLPLTDFIPAYHVAWLEIYYPRLAKALSSLFKYVWKPKKKGEEYSE